ncbi:MAG: phosphatase PAP2 family protein [Sphingomonadales bacterium]|nr:phosphatase PAP2 family protein [Sphingomonadales bacterium]
MKGLVMARTAVILAVGLAASAAVYAAAEQQSAPAAPLAAPTQRMSLSQMQGYLPKGSAPDSLLLDPAPPAAGSAAQARDEEGARLALAQRGSPRWEQAKIDADLFTPNATGSFSCAAGVPISPDKTPKLNALLRKLGPDLAMAVYPTKRKYQRQRPFMVNGQPTCTPESEDSLRRDGSYPSGHSAIGYGWGLVLAEIVPDRAGQLVARGRAFGDSRRVCNVHWLSDIEEGRVVATAVIARVHAEAAFRTDVEAARAEVAALRAKSPAMDCARETAAFASD